MTKQELDPKLKEAIKVYFDKISASETFYIESNLTEVDHELDQAILDYKEKIMESFDLTEKEFDQSVDAYVYGSRENALQNDIERYIDQLGASEANHASNIETGIETEADADRNMYEQKMYVMQKYSLNEVQFNDAFKSVLNNQSPDNLSPLLPENRPQTLEGLESKGLDSTILKSDISNDFKL